MPTYEVFLFKKMVKIHELLFTIVAKNGILRDSFAIRLLKNT